MKTFDNFEEAFDYCREANHPVTVIVNWEKWKLFPSGKAIVKATGKDVTK
jgi:viroplasmin and RNaseH domain-containing protein